MIRLPLQSLLFLAVLLTGCASAGKRLEQGIEAEAEGSYYEAAIRYVEALEKDETLAEARDRKQPPRIDLARVVLGPPRGSDVVQVRAEQGERQQAAVFDRTDFVPVPEDGADVAEVGPEPGEGWQAAGT